MAALPWIIAHDVHGQDLAEFPHLKRWYDALKARPAVIKALDLGKELRTGKMDEEAKKILFGQTSKTTG
jgi:GST-like protein